MVSKNRCLKVGMGPHEDDGAACKALRANGHKMPVILRVIAKVSLKAKYVYSLSLFQWPIIIITDTGHIFVVYVCCFWRDSPQWARASSFTRFLDHTQRRTTVGRTPLDE